MLSMAAQRDPMSARSVTSAQSAKTSNPMSSRPSRPKLMRAKSVEALPSGAGSRLIQAPMNVSAVEGSSGGNGIRKRVMRRNMPRKDVSSSAVAMLRKEEEYQSVPALPPPGEGIPLKPIFILIGPPGTGKHDQAFHIAELLKLVLMTERDLLVEMTKKSVSLPIDLSKAMTENDIGVALDIIQDQLNSAGCLDSGLIIEGFPQTLQQAEALQSLIEARRRYRVVGVIVLEAAQKIILERACGRWVHKASGRAYHEKYHPPKSLRPGSEISCKTMLDDVTGESLEPVGDNVKQIITDKLKTYQENTPRVLDFFSLVEMSVFRIAVNYYKTDDDVWGDIAPIVLKQASSLQPRKNLPAYVPSTTDRRAIKDFALWALDHWDHLYMLFEVPDSTDPTSTSCRVVGFEEFGDYLEKNGFKGDARKIFKIMTAEGPVGSIDSDQISLAQVKRFGRRHSVVDAAIKGTPREGQLGSQFIKLLKYQHGTAFRGWRLDVDLRGNGNVDYSEFSRACNRLGLADKAKGIWACFRPLAFDAVPLTLQDIAKEEYDQVFTFLTILQEKLDFDLDKAWAYMDRDGNGFVTADEFKLGLEELGFHGDSQLLFRGLDTPGLGKLWRHEFDYLSVLRKAPKRQKKVVKRRDSLEFRPTVRPLVRAASARVPFSERPDWDGTLDMTWRKNLEHQAHQRVYFSDLKVKPVRTEMRRRIAETAERVAQEKQLNK